VCGFQAILPNPPPTRPEYERERECNRREGENQAPALRGTKGGAATPVARGRSAPSPSRRADARPLPGGKDQSPLEGGVGGCCCARGPGKKCTLTLPSPTGRGFSHRGRTGGIASPVAREVPTLTVVACRRAPSPMGRGFLLRETGRHNWGSHYVLGQRIERRRRRLWVRFPNRTV